MLSDEKYIVFVCSVLCNDFDWCNQPSMLPFLSLKIRISTNCLCGEVSTTVEVGSLAALGSHRIDLRIEIKPLDILKIHSIKNYFLIN